MAAARAILLPCSLLLAGCMVPQEIEEMEPPREGNAAPRIVARAPQSSTVLTQYRCDRQDFLLESIEDYDRGDTLEVRWFVNYGPERTDPVARGYLPASPEMRDGIRSPPGDDFTLYFRDWGTGTFVVEAVVSDGFDPDDDAEPKGRAVLPGKDWDETSWTVHITDGTACLP